jgi:hypothetical protein
MKKITTYGIRNPDSVLGQVRKCGEVKPVKMIPNTRIYQHMVIQCNIDIV